MSIEFEHSMLEKGLEWAKQEKTIEQIVEFGMEAYAKRFSDISSAFEGKNHTLCCMDEGTPMGDMRSAGSGILTDGDEREAFIASLKAAGVKGVKSHTGCGAAALYRDKHSITDKTVDEVAIEQAKRMAHELGVEYAGHITDLQRPAEFHNARVVYVDGTGKFSPNKVKNLPPGFVISRRYMKPEQALSEVRLATQIAFSQHGFGEKFTQDNPLVVISVGDPDEGAYSTDQLRAELKQLSEQLNKMDPKNAVRIAWQQWEAPRFVETPAQLAA